MKSSFILYSSYIESLDHFTNAQLGELFRAILVYENGEAPTIEDGAVLVAFKFIAADLDKNRAEYEAKCKARSEAGKQGGRPKTDEELADEKQTKAKKANAFSEKQTKAKKANAFSEKQTKAKKANAFSEKQTKAKKAEYEYDDEYDDVSPPNGDIYTRIVDTLNRESGKSFSQHSAATQRLIDARYNEGYTLADFEKVIINKAAEWRGTEFEKFLRPQTLFGTKFEAYLNQKPPDSGFERKYQLGELEKLVPNAIDEIILGLEGVADG